MARECTVCSHPDVFTINEHLVGIGGKLSLRNIAKQFDVNYQAVNRHRQHIPQLLVKASQAMEVADADDLLAKVEELRVKAMDVLTEAEEAHDYRVMLAAIDRASKQLELLAKLLGEISDAPQINILIAPQVQALIVGALAPYPEARLAVAGALEKLEDVA